jgi:Transposase IS66 family
VPWLRARRQGEQADKQELSRPEFEALRLRLRQEKSVPLVKSLGEWLEKQAAAALPKNPLGEAIGNARNQWAALQVYTKVGFLEIDNNAAERALRAVAIGLKNYLFFGSDIGGETAAMLYTFTQTCQTLSIEPWRYLRDVLERFRVNRPSGWGSCCRTTGPECSAVCLRRRRRSQPANSRIPPPAKL